jgi:hypothetical protein
MSASVFVFCTLAMIRATLGLVDRGRVAIGTIVQFAMISVLLCFIIFAPTSLKVEFLRVPHRPVRAIGVHMQPIPGWSSTNWFADLYDVIRGAARPGSRRHAIVALTMTLASVAAAVVTIMISYRHQLRHALAPSSSSGVVAGARLPVRSPACSPAGVVPRAPRPTSLSPRSPGAARNRRRSPSTPPLPSE